MSIFVAKQIRVPPLCLAMRARSPERAQCVDSKAGVDSCYVGTIRRLKPGDKVSIKRNSMEQRVVAGASETFFGLSKI